MAEAEMYYELANKACELEREDHLIEARGLWMQANQEARLKHNRKWSQMRLDFCIVWAARQCKESLKESLHG